MNKLTRPAVSLLIGSALALLLGGCQGGGGLGVNFTGQMLLDDASLQYECIYGKSGAFDSEVTLKKDGQAQASFKMFYGTSGDQWLKLRATQADFMPGATQVGIPITIDCTDLPLGNYEATIKAFSNDKTVPDVQGTIKLRVIPDIARLAVPAQQLDFACTQGGDDPDPQSLGVTNSGLPETLLNAALTANDTWVSATPASFTQIASGASGNSEIAVSCAGLYPGIYNSTVEVKGTDFYKGSTATDSPIAVAIKLTVREPVPSIGLSKTSMSLTCVNGLPSQSGNSDTVRLQNKGVGQLTWQAQGAPAWLTVSPNYGSGIGPNQYNVPDLTFTALCGDPAIPARSQPYTAAVQIVDPTGKADNSPQTVNVSLTVRDKQASININTTRLDLYCYQGTQTSDSKTKSLSNNGDATTTLNWNASDNNTDLIGSAPSQINWLTISPASSGEVGSGIAQGGSQTLTFSADCSNPNFPWPSGITPVTYDATVTITGTTQENGGTARNSPTTFTVRLNVNSNRPSISLSLSPNPREVYLNYDTAIHDCISTRLTETATLAISNDGADHSQLYWDFGSPTTANNVAWWTGTNPLSGGPVAKGSSQNSIFTYNCSNTPTPRNYDQTLTSNTYTVYYTNDRTINRSGTAQIVFRRAYPVITLSPSSLSFSCDYAHRNPAGQTLNISNDGSAIDTSLLKWSASDNQSWLSLSRTSNSTGLAKGAAADPVTVTVDCTGFTTDPSSGTITVTDTSGSGGTSLARPSSRTVSVSVNYKRPNMAVSPTSLTLACDSTKTPVSGTVTVSNNGEDPSWLFWTATSNTGWISVSPAAGPNGGTRSGDASTGLGGLKTGAAGNVATITVDCANPAIYNPNPSGYQGSVTFRGEDPDDNALNTITVNVTAPVNQ